MRTLRSSLALLALPCLLVACNGGDDSSSSGAGASTDSVVDKLRNLGFATLLEALERAGLTAELESSGPITLFAPGESAFAALPPGVLAHLFDPAHAAELESLLRYHLVDGKLDAATLEGLNGVATQQGADLLVDTPGGSLFVNEGRVGPSDLVADNGVVHVVDAVLAPPDDLLGTLDDRGFSDLLDLIEAAGLTGFVGGGGLTVLAPTDAAFDALPPGVLDDLLDPANQAEAQALVSYHLATGRRTAREVLIDGDVPSLDGPRLYFSVVDHELRITGAPASRFNVPATDGVVHVLDEVLALPPGLDERLESPDFATLRAVVANSGLGGLVASPGPFTLFAPTEAAFATLPPGDLADLLDPANAAEAESFVRRHLVGDALQRPEIARRDELATLGGDVLPVAVGTEVTVAGVPLTEAARFSSNGTLYAMPAVLAP